MKYLIPFLSVFLFIGCQNQSSQNSIEDLSKECALIELSKKCINDRVYTEFRGEDCLGYMSLTLFVNTKHETIVDQVISGEINDPKEAFNYTRTLSKEEQNILNENAIREYGDIINNDQWPMERIVAMKKHHSCPFQEL